MWRAIILLLMACGGRPTLEVARPPSFSPPPASSLELARAARRSGDLETARAHYRAPLADGAALELASILDDDDAHDVLAPFAPEAPLASGALEDLEPTPPCRDAALRLAELTHGAPCACSRRCSRPSPRTRTPARRSRYVTSHEGSSARLRWCARAPTKTTPAPRTHAASSQPKPASCTSPRAGSAHRSRRIQKERREARSRSSSLACAALPHPSWWSRRRG